MSKKNTVSPVETLPYDNKRGESYQQLRTSKARQRKIDHVRKLLKRGDWSKARVRHYALHGMNMAGNDVVEAFKDAK